MSDKPPSLDQFDQFDFRELPIGVYMTSIDGQFIVANRTVRMMLELPLDGRLNANIKDYYANPADRDEAISEAKKLAEQGRNVERGILHLKVGERDLYVEEYCKILQNIEGSVIGFVGTMIDITNDFETKIRERELRARVEELTFDIGRILHANTTTMVMIIQSLNSAIQTLEPNPYTSEGIPSSEEIDAILAEYANQVANAIERLVDGVDAQRRLTALSESKWSLLSERANALREFRERIQIVESRPSALRVTAYSVRQTCQEISTGLLPREKVRDLYQAAMQLERVTTLIDVLNTRSAALQMEYTLQSLRDYVTAEVRDVIKRAKFPVRYLIDESVKRLVNFAQSTLIDIQIDDIVNVNVEVNEREVVRALSNILHNAIKYTWRRERTKPSWVSITTKVDEKFVYIQMENWGVPISREEIEQELIFKLGYRGQSSSDRGRLGTGIGLTDARRVAQSNGGNVLVESRPTRLSKSDDPEYYKQPFITKVTFYIPIVQ